MLDVICVIDMLFMFLCYLQKWVDVGLNVVVFENICEVLKVFVFLKDDDVVECVEVGIVDIFIWRFVVEGLIKVVWIKYCRDLLILE